MYKKALETSMSLHRGPVGGTWRRGSFTGDIERRVNFIFIRRLFTSDFEKYIKKGSENVHVSL
jgi:hypothetical protein